tara:strand:- start:502 stop:1050 length:549 start_codon:yes stop_codon:yes gene_type:complete
MKIFFLFLTIIFFSTKAIGSIKDNIIQNLKEIENVKFNFEQNINGKIESGICTIKYPKKIFCEYILDNKKILVSNGKSLVIKTLNSYYIYPLKKTPLNLILDKNFLIDNIEKLEEEILDDKLVNFKMYQDENEINLFFDKKNFDLVGWQTRDIYQNLSITYINSLKKNDEIIDSVFKLPIQD